MLGIIAAGGGRVSVTEPQAVAMRDRMVHRGPDGAGLWQSPGVLLGHRRLAVIDLSETGHQPMRGARARSAIVYNGELYNDAEVRAFLRERGTSFRGPCDTETVLAAVDRLGHEAMGRLRGMYAFGHVDLDAGVVTLARDPLGVKPLYYAIAQPSGTGGRPELVFASEIQAILAHPAISVLPDIPVVSAYLTTIRTTLGPRTLFAGVRAVLPGEWIEFDYSGPDFRLKHHDWWSTTDAAASESGDVGLDVVSRVRASVTDSVRRHLRADVPTSCLLSGGLDSSIICDIAARVGREESHPRLSTYCSGAAEDLSADGDFAHARRMAALLDSGHTEAPVTRAMFAERWAALVTGSGLPLSTPNEVAINQVARTLRADGKVVTLSGEGADELFAGYDIPLTAAARHVASLAGCQQGEWRRVGGGFQLDSSAWIARNAKPTILNEPVWVGLEDDQALTSFYRDEFERVSGQRDDGDPLQAHLRFVRRINLAGLLLRLDSATMLESVEGRTPFADQAVATLGESLAMSEKFDASIASDVTIGGTLPEHRAGQSRTKIALRRAFADRIPMDVLRRPKASFPLPFQEWVGDSAGVLRQSEFARSLFTTAAIETVASQPRELWQLAWPMVNIAMWGRRWWG